MELAQQDSSQRQPLAASLRWLQFCLLLLFGHDVLCFSLGYPFLPSVFGGAATGIAFSCYGLASIAVLLLLLLVSGNSSSDSSRGTDSPGSSTPSKFWRITAAAALAAAAGAANTALPSSYAMLLLTKAVQGAASALYFVDSLSLVAAVYPRAYRTQAMAFISAGLTVGDALGPVLGGAIFQAAGLRAALALQPAASVAAVAAWGLLLLWRKERRPWNLTAAAAAAAAAATAAQPAGATAAATAAMTAGSSACRQHAGGQEGLGAWLSSMQAGPTALTAGSSSILEPLLSEEWCDAAPTADALAPAAQSVARGASAGGCFPVSTAAAAQPPAAQFTERLPLSMPHSLGTPAAAAAAARQAAPLSRLQLLQQLLRRPAISSLCLLALMAQAARTAVDLLLPIMLEGSVQPGFIGLLFAGEAVGSVVAPFLVDGLLHRHSNKPRSSSSGSSSSSGGSCKPGQKGQREGTGGKGKPTTSSSSRYASWLLLLSAVGMAVCCALVLTAWQLPAAVQVASLHRQAGGATAATVHMTGFGIRRLQTAGAAEAVSSPPHAAQQAAGHLATGSPSNGWGQQGEGRGSDADPLAAGSCLVANTSWVESSACAFVQMQELRHTAWSGLLPAAASPAADSIASSPDFGNVNVTERLAGSESERSHFVAESAEASGCFGPAELAVIGLVLFCLGSFHSSCETLIYAVLTDIIAPSEGDGIESCDDVRGASVTAECENCPSECCCHFQGVCSQQCQQHPCAASAHAAPAVCVLAGGYVAVAPQSDVDAVPVANRSKCFAAAAVAADVANAAVSGSSPADAASVDAAAGSNASGEFDLEIQVSDSGSPCSLKRACSQGVCCVSDNLAVTCDSHTSAKPVQATASDGAAAAAADSSGSDCTEVVMVLYVLFWVVGFSAGAAVVGLLPGTGLGQLQAVASVLAVLLAAAGRWTWLAVAA